jgi:hypothetical protein
VDAGGLGVELLLGGVGLVLGSGMVGGFGGDVGL